MCADIQIIDPTNYASWNELLLAFSDCSIFHTSNWASVLAESYRYAPLYFAEIQNSKLVSLVPCMGVSSILTGRRGVSLPFTDYCDPLLSESNLPEDLMGRVIEYGKEAGWRSIELRTGKTVPSEFMPSSFFYGHAIDLSKAEEELFQGLRASTQRNIRKAVREGVEVSFDNSLDSLKEFYRLNCGTRKDHGLPPQPYAFFRKVHEHILSKNLGHLMLASHNGINIAGALFFHFGGQIVYKYGASDKARQDIRANNLIMWKAIQWYCLNGHKSLSLGRTEPENLGLLQFKRGWGAAEYMINYYKYDFKKSVFVKDAPMISGFHNKVFRTLPMPALKLAGSLLYRHMG